MLKKNFNGLGLIFSPFLQGKSHSKKVAYIGLFTAFLIVCNGFFSFPIGDVQFSITIFASLMAGVILGPMAGFFAYFIADLLGYFISSGGLFYYFWVGLSTSTFALIAGLLFIKQSQSKSIKCTAIKVTLIILISFVVCTVIINSTGFYIYNKNIGFLTSAIEYAKDTFGSEVSFFIYLVYRLIFRGQIFNSLFNYALFIISLPALKRLKLL
ncbi:MAG: ECF transporter S component [Clostridia bacterium]|nr:ECF transporter S component [Clostridia bacterium]